MKFLSYIFVAFLVLTSCGSSYRSVTTAKGQKLFNVEYGAHKQQTMDVFLPSKLDMNSDFVIIIHGGAWSFGNKRNVRMTQKFLYDKGVASANINYRLVNDRTHLDQQMNDISRVVELLKRDLSRHGLRHQKFTLLGESSGGHLALLYGYDNPKQINKIIALFPPTDFVSKRGENKLVAKASLPIMKNLLGSAENIPPDTIQNALRRASPAYKVKNIPTLLFHGTWDFIVDKEQSIILDSVLQSKNIPHKLVLVKRGTHFMRLNPNTRKHIIYPEILKWIRN